MERPELRQFRKDPVATVLSDRGRYVAAVLTIVRAYITAGCPDECRPSLASFGDWSRLVRSSLVWLGREDPIKTMEAARAEDPVRSELTEVFAAWRAVIGINNPMTAGELKEKALSAMEADCGFHKAISAVACAPGRSEIETVRLGKWLSRNKGRIINKLKLRGEKDKHSLQLVWWLDAA
jgi:putative DNA primase/helicase